MEFEKPKISLDEFNNKKNNLASGRIKLAAAILILFLIAASAAALLFFGVNKNLQSIFPELKFWSREIDESAPKQIIINEESATIKAVEKNSPAVVSIVVSKNLKDLYSLSGTDLFPFYDFFGFPFENPRYIPDDNGGTEKEDNGKRRVGGGTGFIISDNGLVLTNKHVVSDENAEYTVITNEGKKYDAKVLARDPFNDIAIVKIDAENLPIVELGDSEQLKLGQTVIAIGYSLGKYRNTVTKGVVSGVGRRVEAGDSRGISEILEEAIQTDAAINPGNSGGPLINLSGQVIGINTAISMEGQLVGFAIPINQAKQVIESVKKFGKIVRPFLGVRYILINEEIAKANNLDFDHGALIVRGGKISDLAVVPGSPADKADLEENDIILEVNGQKIDEEHGLSKEISKYKPGDKIELKIWHKGKENTVKITLEEYKG